MDGLGPYEQDVAVDVELEQPVFDWASWAVARAGTGGHARLCSSICPV